MPNKKARTGTSDEVIQWIEELHKGMAAQLRNLIISAGFDPRIPLDCVNSSMGDHVVFVEVFQGGLDEVLEVDFLYNISDVNRQSVLHSVKSEWVLEEVEGRTLEDVAKELYRTGYPVEAKSNGPVVVFSMGDRGAKGKRVMGTKELCDLAADEIVGMVDDFRRDWEER